MSRALWMAGLVALAAPLAAAGVTGDSASAPATLFTCQFKQGGGFALGWQPASRQFTLTLSGRQPRSYAFSEARQWFTQWSKGWATTIELTGGGHSFTIQYYTPTPYEPLIGYLGEGEGDAMVARECRERTIHFHDRFGRKPWADPRYALWDLAEHHITRGMAGWPG